MQRRALSLLVCAAFFLTLLTRPARAQGSSVTVSGQVTDPTGALIPNAVVRLSNPVSGFDRTTIADAAGQWRFPNVPFNSYRVSATMTGFTATSQSLDLNSLVPVAVTLRLGVLGSSTTVNVEAAGDLVENDATMHTDVDRALIDKLPIESASSELSSIVTLASPGIAADSNGLFHGLGDHAENSFSVDGQPITDQQSKVFSNQLPADAVQSLQVIDGAPPAEFGDKTSLVIVATTRSGQGVTTPHGSIVGSYGSFGTGNLSANVAYGGKNWGNFVSANGLQSGRFLDAPEFSVMHDKGNEANFFDRIDRQISDVSNLHINLQYTRSWFQTPNTFDTSNVFDQNGRPLGATDQRSKIQTFDIAPTYTRTLGSTAVFNFGPYVRRDGFSYYPSKNPLADFGPLQGETVQQYRTLLNAGLHTDISYVKGINTVKAGVQYSQTFLRENDTFGIVDPNLNDPASTAYNPVLAPYDLTRGGTTYTFHGRTDVKELAIYAQDQITLKQWLFSFGMRGDFYNGLSIQRQAEPRAGLSYTIAKTGTVLRASYARTQETPFNENLVLSSNGCTDPVLNGIFSTIGQCTAVPFNPGFRNEFHAGFQQAFSRHLVVSAEYIWKYTHNGYDFSTFGNTPIFFPIEWHNSKIPGFVLRANVPETHGFSAFVNMSSVAARFFNPQVGGVGAVVGTGGGVNYPFRIDHDERYNQTAHIQYNLPFRKTMWYGFNWRYDSGLVAGAAPCYNISDPNSICNSANGGPSITLANGQPGVNLSYLTADEQFQSGLTCDGVKATVSAGFTQCDAAGLTSTLISIPKPGTENDDKNPQRIAPRNLFDMTLGEDNLLHGDRLKVGLRATAINVTNKYALYNFLSTFSGTHYVTPRSVTGEISFNF